MTSTIATIPPDVATAAPPYDGIREGAAELALRRHRLVDDLYERCQWYELALQRHGWTGERLQKAARRIVNDYLRANIPYLAEHRRQELVDFVTEKALQAALRFRPERATQHYGRNGGNHFDSWVCDEMSNRCIDWLRSKHEGNGDRRYANDNRIVLDDDPDPADHDVDFSKIVSDRERSDWQRAAQMTGWELDEWMKITLNKGAKQVLRSAA